MLHLKFHPHVSPSSIMLFEDLYSNFPDDLLIHNWCVPSADKASRESYEVSTSFVCRADGPLMMYCIWYTHPTPHPGHLSWWVWCWVWCFGGHPEPAHAGPDHGWWNQSRPVGRPGPSSRPGSPAASWDCAAVFRTLFRRLESSQGNLFWKK